MADIPDDDYIKRFSKTHKMPFEDVKNLINNSADWENVLDKTAFENAKLNGAKQGFISKYIKKDKISQETLDVAGDLDTKNMRHMTPNGINNYAKMQAVDRAKDSGKFIAGRGENTGYSTSVKQARDMPQSERWKKLGASMMPLGRSSMDSMSDAIGTTGANTKALAAKGSIMNKLSRRVIMPSVGILTAYDAINAEDPLNSYATFAGASWGVQQGWRIGRDASDVMGTPSALKRIPLGAAGAVGLGAAVGGSMWALGDISRNDSAITKKAKSYYRRETMATTQDTRESLTMRASAFDKLSASSMNNRGQLLGNEANILKNAQY